MALSKLGEGTEDAMPLLAGFGSELDGGGGGGGSLGLFNLAVERFARIASNIISTGSPHLTPGDIVPNPFDPSNPDTQPR